MKKKVKIYVKTNPVGLTDTLKSFKNVNNKHLLFQNRQIGDGYSYHWYNLDLVGPVLMRDDCEEDEVVEPIYMM